MILRSHSRCLICFLALLSLRPAVGDTLLLDGVAAQVNEAFITIGEVMEIVRELDPRLAGALPPETDPRLRETYETVLTELIDRELILQNYRAGDGKLPAWVIDQRIAEIVAERFDGDRAALRAALSQQGLEMPEWRSHLESQMILSAMRQAHAEQPAVVSPEMIREYFERHRDHFTEAAATHVQLIVLRPEGEDEAAWEALDVTAQRALDELRAGQTFAEVARRYSSGRHAETGGDWGWIDPDAELRPELAEAVAALADGEHSGVIRTPQEAYLVRVKARRQARQLTLEQARDRIYRELRQSRVETFYNAWVDRLRETAQIVVYPLPQ